MDDESMQLVARNNHTGLLRRARCRRVDRHVPVQDPPGAHPQDDEHVEHSKRRGDDHEKIAGEDASHVVSANVLQP
jgi:hypothetical protein